jgi:pimeloyl-ACP methyl ester carboxylesterase
MEQMSGQMSGRLSDAFGARTLANDARSIDASTQALFSTPNVDELLPTMTMPCLVYAGEEDNWFSGAKEGVRHMPNANFVALPGLNHMQAYLRWDIVHPHVVKFLAEVSQG